MNLENLYFLREQQELTQKDLAKILNVDRSSISLWENNKEIIPLPKLVLCANFFKVSMDFIIGLNTNKNDIPFDSSHTIDNKIVGDRLKKFRKDFKLTQVKLATKLNTTHSTISAYESGKTLILTAFAFQICKEYGISLDWICGRSNVEFFHKK